MALTIGELVKWTKDQILNVQDNVENRKLDFGKEGYLKGKWNDSLGDYFEVIKLNGVEILVDGHHRQDAIKRKALTDLPKLFPVLLREADSIEDIRNRQDALMENKRAPTAGQRKDIASKRVKLGELKSKHAKAVGVTAYKQLGFKGSDLFIKWATDYRKELSIIDEWDIEYKKSMFSQGILAAVLKTIRMNEKLAHIFWTNVTKNASDKHSKKVRAKMIAGGMGEGYNSACFELATDRFEQWAEEMESNEQAFTPAEPEKKEESDNEFLLRLTGLRFGDLLEEEDEKRLTSLKEKGNEKAATIYELLTAPEPAEGDKNGNVLPVAKTRTQACIERFRGIV